MKLKNLLNVPQSKYDAKTILKWLWQAWRGNQLQAVLNACIGFASVGVSLAQVWAVQHAIDVASGVIVGSIYWAVALMGVFILCDYSLNIASVWLRNILGIKAQNPMQQQMLDRILRSEWQGKESRHSGDVLNRLEFDVSNVVNYRNHSQYIISIGYVHWCFFLFVLHGQSFGHDNSGYYPCVYSC